MNILIACEYSGTVRDAFIKAGHNAQSCDILPSDSKSGKHWQGRVEQLLAYPRMHPFDMMIAFPPCTHLAVSGARWFKNKQKEQKEAIDFFMLLADANIPKIAIENPVGIMSTKWRKPDQIIQPWAFGHNASKKTCLWLKNLPPLKPTNIIHGKLFCCGEELTGAISEDKYGCPNCCGQKTAKRRHANQTKSGQNKLGPSPNRGKIRSLTYNGIADAMATQWR